MNRHPMLDVLESNSKKMYETYADLEGDVNKTAGFYRVKDTLKEYYYNGSTIEPVCPDDNWADFTI